MNGITRMAPKFLNLAAIRFPVGAIASILHRVSGVVLLIALPILARSLDLSLQGPQQFDALLHAATHSWIGIVVFVGVWAVVHHICAGVRHLLMDSGMGVQLSRARTSATIAIAAGIVAALLWLAAWVAS